jgi:hypothetical protein
MITDNDLFAAIASAVREVESGKISISIATRDIRCAVREFDAQATEPCNEVSMTNYKMA